MSVYRLGSEVAFPPPDDADPCGLLAVGGDLSPERLLLAYAMGIFPWFSCDQPILWHSPDPRLVLPPAEVAVSRNLRRVLKRSEFSVTLDTAFDSVIEACAKTPRRGELDTWITPGMIEAYRRLHRLGFAHSAETWRSGELVGGLYGVSLGGCFFGESMFTLQNDASKVAFVTLARQLEAWDFDLIDCQVHTDHLARFGARALSRRDFLQALDMSLSKPTRRGRWSFEAP